MAVAVLGAVWPGCGAVLRCGRWPARLMVLRVAPRVFRVLRVLCKAGSGCLVCAQQFRMQFPCDSFKI